MFGRRRQRHTNILFVIFRLILSLVMFAVLLAGAYSAYKHFSGLDPLKLDPQVMGKQFLAVLGQKTDGSSIIDLKNLTKPGSQSSGSVLFSFLLVADSHSNNVNLQKAISQAKQSRPDLSFIIGLGDYTDVGTVDELKSAKKQFDSSGLRYFLVPGDHDLWDSRNKSQPPISNFKEVFGPDFQSFNFKDYKILLLDNSDDYKGLGDEQLRWISAELEKAKTDRLKGMLVFVHEPLFHPSSDHVMGKVEKDLKQQARNLIFQFKEARLPDGQAGVKKVFAGDIHYFSEYNEPETSLAMVTIGAVTSERNPQAPRFAVGYVFEDGSIRVEDVEIR